jgi:glycogen operon protein
MSHGEWSQSRLRAFGFRLCGEAMDEVDERGKPVTDDTLLVLLNADPDPLEFALPDPHPGSRWEAVVNTAAAKEPRLAAISEAGARLGLDGRSLALLRAIPSSSDAPAEAFGGASPGKAEA